MRKVSNRIQIALLLVLCLFGIFSLLGTEPETKVAADLVVVRAIVNHEIELSGVSFRRWPENVPDCYRKCFESEQELSLNYLPFGSTLVFTQGTELGVLSGDFLRSLVPKEPRWVDSHLNSMSGPVVSYCFILDKKIYTIGVRGSSYYLNQAKEIIPNVYQSSPWVKDSLIPDSIAKKFPFFRLKDGK